MTRREMVARGERAPEREEPEAVLIEAEIAAVLSRYDVGAPLEACRAVHGYVNETTFVRTSRGRFVVRRNHRRFGEAKLRYRHALLDWLHQRFAPVPALIANRDGDTLVALGGRFYEVHAYVEGEAYDPHRTRQLASIGATLAAYHEAVCGFPALIAEAAPRYSPYAVCGLAEQLVERDVMGELHDLLAWYGARAGQLRAQLPEDAYRALPHLVIHGDIHSDNLRFCGDQVVALLDFDQVCWDARLVDLADALVAFASRPDQQRGWGVFAGPIDPERATQLLAAYAARAPLTPHETAALVPLVELIWLQGELGRVVSTPEGAPEYHRSVLEQGRALSAWLADYSNCVRLN